MGFMKELFGMGDQPDEKNTRQEGRNLDVMDESGTPVGRVDNWMVDEDQSQVRYGVLNHNDRRKLVPVGDLDYDDDRRAVIARGYDSHRINSLNDYDASTWNEETERRTYMEHHPGYTGETPDYDTDRFRAPQRLQLLQEKLNIGKRKVATGEVEISKRAVSEPVSEQVTLESERAEIKRTPVNRPAQGNEAIGANETIKVSMFGEEPVIHKETVVTEEVEINKVTDKRTETVTDQVRREELVTEGLDQQREATFASAEPSEAELLERRRYEQNRQAQVDVLPIDEESNVHRPI